jgi:uncharacterized protein (TIGR02677 family)
VSPEIVSPDADGPDATTAAAARLLFRYVTVEEWEEYRAIMAVFAGTFFAEFTPDDVVGLLRREPVTGIGAGVGPDPDTVADRLESLRRWGNLTVSSSVGNPTSIIDYYRRRNRYLITRAGQEVHDAVEGLLARVDEVRDVSTSRLRALHDALEELARTDVGGLDPDRLADLVRAVFDPHVAFTDEITQFFVAINQWQSRYDLTDDELRFFAEVLVGYVNERLHEIERVSRPIGRLLVAVAPAVPTVVERASQGLSDRVVAAGLGGKVTVKRPPGSRIEDWDHLAGWFVTAPGRPSRIDRLGREALSAIRTLTLNLTRLSRVGVAASSRRADFLRLAAILARATPDELPRLGAAAFGLGAANHWGALAEDSDDPVAPTLRWADAPKATVPVSLRERGDTTNRGRTSPMRDRAAAERRLRAEREHQLRGRRRVDTELLASVPLGSRELSVPALARLEEVLGRCLRQLGPSAASGTVVDGVLRCAVERDPGGRTCVPTVAGTLTIDALCVTLSRSDEPGTGHTAAAATEAAPGAR